jgi:hypothetical protein
MESSLITKPQVDRFLELCSGVGLLSIYALKLSFEKSIAFNRKDLVENTGLTSEDYFYGFIIACRSIELINYNAKNDVYQITSINPILAQNIEAALLRRQVQLPILKEKIEKIKVYFEVN